MTLDRTALLEALIPAVRAAGAQILAVYATDFAARSKRDGSPVSAADQRAEAVLTAELARLTPALPMVAEEAVAAGRVPAVGHRFWLVDPLDGTKEFVGRNGEFTVNVGLIEHGRPTLGLVLAPALGLLYAGAEGAGAFVESAQGRRPIACRVPPMAGLTVVASRSHSDTAAIELFLRGRRIAELRYAGSALKFCLIASGEADLYPRLGDTMEWDSAAGDAILRAAGGTVATLSGEPLGYGKTGFRNPHFVASSG